VNGSQETEVRNALKSARTIVVKVGSRSLAARPDLPALLAQQFASLKSEGRNIVLISSGAVALGIERLGYSERPSDIGQIRAAASAGQSLLMHRYDNAFRSEGLISAQVLITHGDLSNRLRVNNTRDALAALLDAGAIPIINQNDTVATNDQSFNDNDELSAMVTPLVDADALVLLTDVNGVLSPQNERISFLESPDDFVDLGSQDSVGSGGMSSKIDAAYKARRAGAAVVIASALDEGCLTRALSGADIGTCLPRLPNELRARQHWIAYVLRPRGTIIVDRGAAKALKEHDGSLLPIGVVGLRGEFRRGDSVRIETISGDLLGHGLARTSALETARAAGKKGSQLLNAMGGETDTIIIHRDDLVRNL